MIQDTVFVDSSAWVAFFRTEDRHHHQAGAAWDEILAAHVPLVTTEYILAETLTVVERLAGHALAVAGGQRIMESLVVQRTHITRGMFLEAWEEYRRTPRPGVSFVDTTSFVVLRQLGIRRVFTFDQDFRAAGFESLPA